MDPYLIKEASDGDKERQYKLGLMYCSMGDAKNAIHWLREAQKNHHKKAPEVLNEILHCTAKSA